MLKDKISASIQGGINNLNTGDVPNFSRPSPVWLEQYLNESLQLKTVGSHYPAISFDDSAIVIEPIGDNWVQFNCDLGEEEWIKGTNVRVFPDSTDSPDTSTYQADRISWTARESGDPSRQLIRQAIRVPPGQDCYLSAILRLPNGEIAGSKDVLRLTGSVQGSPAIALSQLNSYPNRYRILGIPFKSGGNQIQVPDYNHFHYTVETVGQNTVSSLMTNIQVGRLNGGFVQFGDRQKAYSIIDNSAPNASGLVTLTLDSSPLTDGVTAGTTIKLRGQTESQVWVELYVESSLTLHFGGIQIETRPFRTSMIYQKSERRVRAATRLAYRKNPIANLKNFAFLIDIKDWRGDGNLFDAVNLSAEIVGGLLQVKIGSNTVSGLEFPARSKLLIQINSENSEALIYINNSLRARTNIYDFIGTQGSFTLSSTGYRAIYQIVVFDQPLLSEEVAQVFRSKVLVDSVAISASAPHIVLPPVQVPPPNPPIARSKIRSLNIASATVTVADATNFAVNKPVSVLRDGRTVLITRVQGKTNNDLQNNDLQLELVYGIVVGDLLVYGDTDQPGRASVRFPFTPIDRVEISEVEPTLNRLKVSSTLSFTLNRALVLAQTNEDIAEVQIQSKDDQRGYLFVDNVSSIQAGHIIVQPLDELWIDPSCYDAFLLEPINGVDIGYRFLNGLELINRNPFRVTAQAAIRPLAY